MTENDANMESVKTTETNQESDFCNKKTYFVLDVQRDEKVLPKFNTKPRVFSIVKSTALHLDKKKTLSFKSTGFTKNICIRKAPFKIFGRSYRSNRLLEGRYRLGKQIETLFKRRTEKRKYKLSGIYSRDKMKTQNNDENCTLVHEKVPKCMKQTACKAGNEMNNAVSSGEGNTEEGHPLLLFPVNSENVTAQSRPEQTEDYSALYTESKDEHKTKSNFEYAKPSPVFLVPNKYYFECWQKKQCISNKAGIEKEAPNETGIETETPNETGIEKQTKNIDLLRDNNDKLSECSKGGNYLDSIISSEHVALELEVADIPAAQANAVNNLEMANGLYCSEISPVLNNYEPSIDDNMQKLTIQLHGEDGSRSYKLPKLDRKTENQTPLSKMKANNRFLWKKAYPVCRNDGFDHRYAQVHDYGVADSQARKDTDSQARKDTDSQARRVTPSGLAENKVKKHCFAHDHSYHFPYRYVTWDHDYATVFTYALPRLRDLPHEKSRRAKNSGLKYNIRSRSFVNTNDEIFLTMKDIVNRNRKMLAMCTK